jgi:hypothetical protein
MWEMDRMEKKGIAAIMLGMLAALPVSAMAQTTPPQIDIVGMLNSLFNSIIIFIRSLFHVETICTPNARYCNTLAGGGSTVRQCAADGMSYVVVAQCSGACSGGACLN